MKLLALTLLVVASALTFASPPPSIDAAKQTIKPRASTYFQSVQHLRR